MFSLRTVIDRTKVDKITRRQKTKIAASDNLTYLVFIKHYTQHQQNEQSFKMHIKDLAKKDFLRQTILSYSDCETNLNKFKGLTLRKMCFLIQMESN